MEKEIVITPEVLAKLQAVGLPKGIENPNWILAWGLGRLAGTKPKTPTATERKFTRWKNY